MRRGSLAAVILLCLVAGCGDKSGDDSGGSSTVAENDTGADQDSGVTTGPGTDATGGDEDTGSGTGTGGGGDAIGAPKPRKGGRARGAPIRIPAQQADQGRPLDEVVAFIRDEVRKQCGGSECVHWRIEYRSEGTYDRCHFVRTEPGQRSKIPRGSTFVVVAGAEPCEDEDDGTGPGGDSGQPSGEETPEPVPDQSP